MKDRASCVIRRVSRRVVRAVFAAAVVAGFGNASAGMTELEWIKGDSLGFVLTDYVPEPQDRVEMKVKFADVAANQCLWCSRFIGEGYNTFTAQLISGKLRFDYGQDAVGATSTSAALEADVVYVVTEDGGKRTWSVKTEDGTVVSSGVLSATGFSPTGPFVLFGGHTLGSNISTSTARSSFSNRASFTMYSFRVYDEHGALVRDFVPAHDDTKSGASQYGVYERKSARYFPEAQSTFTVGPAAYGASGELIVANESTTGGTVVPDVGRHACADGASVTCTATEGMGGGFALKSAPTGYTLSTYDRETGIWSEPVAHSGAEYVHSQAGAAITRLVWQWDSKSIMLNAKAYVTDGLIFQLDGIANNGVVDGVDQHVFKPASFWTDIGPSAVTTRGNVVSNRMTYSPNAGIIGYSVEVFANVPDVLTALQRKRMTMQMMLRPREYTSNGGYLFIGGVHSERELSLDMDARDATGAVAANSTFACLQYASQGWDSSKKACLPVANDYFGRRVLVTVTIDDEGAHLYFDDGNLFHLNPGKGLDPTSDLITIGRWVGYSCANFELNSLRFYDRVLSRDEISFNRTVDKLRFDGEAGILVGADGPTCRQRVTTDGPGLVQVGTDDPVAAAETWIATNATVVLKPVAAEGYKFLSWTGDNERLEIADDGSVTVSGIRSRSLVCKFVSESQVGIERAWTGAGGDGQWDTPENWYPAGVPSRGDDITIPGAVSVTVTNTTAELGSLTLTGALVFTNWTTCVRANTVRLLKNSSVTCAGPVADEADMSRVWFACGDLIVDAGATVTTDGKGWAGGKGPGVNLQPIAKGGGGSHGGLGSFKFTKDTCPYAVGLVYGDPAAPETAGSGGYGGRAGGGVIRIDATNRVTICGKVTADGLGDTGASGAGGSVYVTTRTFAGTNGMVRARGGVASTAYAGEHHSGGGGRVAVVFDRQAQAEVGAPRGMCFSADCGPFHGPSRDAFSQAQPGTLYFSSDTLIDRQGATLFGRLDFADVTDTWTVDSLRLTNGWASLYRDGVKMHVTGDFEVTGKALEQRRHNGVTNLVGVPDSNGTRWDVGGSAYEFTTNAICYFQVSTAVPRLQVDGDLKVNDNGIVQIVSAKEPLDAEATEPALTNLGAQVTVAGRIVLSSTGKVYCRCHPWSGASPSVSAASLTVDATSFVDANGEGYYGGKGNNAYPGVNKFGLAPAWPTSLCGGGHGGKGGWNTATSTGMGPAYDAVDWPLMPGCGGHGTAAYGPRGGGVVRLFVSGAATVDGAVRADAGEALSQTGSGAGGTVMLQCQALAGSGTISACGTAGSVYSKSSNPNNGGGGGGGRIAVHYDMTAQGASGVSFSAAGGEGVGGGVYTGSGDAGTVWFPDDRLLTSGGDYPIKGGIVYAPDVTRYYRGGTLTMGGLLDLPPGGFVESSGDVAVYGTSVEACGINVPEGYFRCDGDLILSNAHLTVTGGATPLADRFAVGGNVILDNATLTLTCAETDLDSTMAIGGSLVLTNGATVTLQAACDPVEGDPGLVVTAGRLEMASGTWIYPYSHNTNGASVLFRIQKVALAPNAGFNANTKGYGRVVASPAVQYGPDGFTFDGRGLDGNGAKPTVAPGYGGKGGAWLEPGTNFNKVVYPKGRGLVWGNYKRPTLPGLGGAGNRNLADYLPPRGGGLIRIESEDFDLNGGSLLANGGPGGASAFRTGSTGGAIYVKTYRFRGGNGILSANGGQGSDYGGSSEDWDMPSAGGGRIALWHWVGDTNATMTASGAAAPIGDDKPDLKKLRSGEDGTVYVHQSKGMTILVR